MATGQAIKPMAKVNSILSTATFTAENGLLIRHMDRELIHIQTELCMLGNLPTINRMATGKKLSLMVQNI